MPRSHILHRDRLGKCKNYEWMLNENGMNPCKLVEQLCTVERLGAVSGNLPCPSSANAPGCCCSVATYALLSACWVCQGNDPGKIDVDIGPSYADFFQQSGCTNDSISNFSSPIPQSQSSDLPLWAWVPPNSLNDHWNLTEAQADAMALSPNSSQSVISILTFPSSSPSFSSSSNLPTVSASNLSSSASSHSAASSGTITASLLGSVSFVAFVVTGVWFVCRRRQRRLIRPSRGTRVDLTEPEMAQSPPATHADFGTDDPLRRHITFPFPYEGVVPHYHPNVQHSIEPSRTDNSTLPDDDHDPRTPRRHSKPVSLHTPMDQLDKDLARLQGVAVDNSSTSGHHVENPSTNWPHTDEPSTSLVNKPPLGEGEGQVHYPYIHKTPRRRAASITTFTQSSNSGSGSSRRARRKSSMDNISNGKYFHLPPSAQYLANIARYPEKVDPERPWDIRGDARAL